MKAIIEMPKGTNEKTEIDKKTGMLVIDRTLNINIPANYGFIDRTLAEDGDPLDIFVLGPTLSGLTEVQVSIIGVFFCSDQGIPDHKLLGVPENYQEENLNQVVRDIRTYLSSYKQGFKVFGYSEDVMSAYRVYRKTRIRERYIHQKLSLWGVLGIFAFGGILILLDYLLKKL